jgi:hypothetical protein
MAKPNYAAMADLYRKARAAGLAAASDCKPIPMVVCQRADPLNDNSPIVKRYAPVMDGPCGFAWINVKPGNGPMARYLKAEGLARSDSYEGGVCVWVGEFNQSMARKEAYAAAFADVMRAEGIRAYANSRMD